VQGVVPVAAQQFVALLRPRQRVVTAPTDDRLHRGDRVALAGLDPAGEIDRHRRAPLRVEQPVEAVAAVDLVAAEAAVELVVARTARERIDPRPAPEIVRRATADEPIVTGVALEQLHRDDVGTPKRVVARSALGEQR
jgi:hypothetical protein